MIIDDEHCDLHLKDIDFVEHNSRCKIIRRLFEDKWIIENSEPVKDEDVLRVHTERYWFLLQKRVPAITMSGDLPMTFGSLTSIKYAAGAGIKAINKAMEGNKRIFCNIRPPGHHASRGIGNGFCFLNNIAISAAYAKTLGFKNILIWDFDVHAGNGTRKIFAKKEGFFLVSIHYYSPDFYPGKEGSPLHNCWNILNVPIHTVDRKEYLKVHRKTAEWFKDRYSTDLILISAGFDSHEADKLGVLKLKTDDYATITHDILSINPNVPIISFLEGGYHEYLAESVKMHLNTLFADVDKLK